MDYRRLMLDGEAARLLQQPLLDSAGPFGQPQQQRHAELGHSATGISSSTTSNTQGSTTSSSSGSNTSSASGSNSAVFTSDSSSSTSSSSINHSSADCSSELITNHVSSSSSSLVSAPEQSHAHGATSEHPNRLYYWPLGVASAAAMESMWQQLTADTTGNHHNSHAHADRSNRQISRGSHQSRSPRTVIQVLFGRHLVVSRCAAGAAWFEFEELCNRPLGAADYMALSQHFHTVFISGEH